MTKVPDCVDEKTSLAMQESSPSPASPSAEAPGQNPSAIIEPVGVDPAEKPVQAATCQAPAAPIIETAAIEPAPGTKPIAAIAVPPSVAAAISAPAAPVANAPAPKAPASAPKPVTALRPVKPTSEKPATTGRLRDFAEAHGFKAAGVALALGAGWLLGANTFENEAAGKRVVAAIEALDAKVDSVMAQSAGRDDVVALRASVDQSRTGLDATRNNAAAAVAQLTNKFDRSEREHSARLEKMEKEFAARLERLTERLDRAERAAAAHGPTASLPQLPTPAAPAPITLPARPPGPRSEETRVPQNSGEARSVADRGRIPINGYVLREVRDGAAIVEGRMGLREVIPGDTLPGVGRVRSIERRGRQWVVVTTSGIIDAGGY